MAHKENRMNTMRRGTLLKLVSSVYEVQMDVMRGVVLQDANGRYLVDTQTVDKWLQQHFDKEVTHGIAG